jgi:hypothetical protein
MHPKLALQPTAWGGTIWGLALIAALAVPALSGCTSNGVGDPCQPESIPTTGFDPREVYLETSSVQCRTRTCMVYQLDGDPSLPAGTPGALPEREIDNRVFCSCRCGVPEGTQTNTPLCECGQGFACTEVVTAGSSGLQGSYCIRCRCPDDVDLATDFPRCPESQCEG